MILRTIAEVSIAVTLLAITGHLATISAAFERWQREQQQGPDA